MAAQARVRAFTFIEVVLGILVLTVAAIIGAYMGQLTLSEHARNLSLAVNDANRIIETIRQRNSPCVVAVTGSSPTALSSTGANWDAWLADPSAGGGAA